MTPGRPAPAGPRPAIPFNARKTGAAMTNDQVLILSILAITVGMFLWGRWRHDMVAMGALLACVLGGLLTPDAALAGFGHPAVITVACVLVMSRGLLTSGAVDVLTRHVLPARAGATLSLAALMGLGAVLSGFMNNVGAMALLMPVAIQLAGRLKLAPGQVLMPLAFGTILGGMTTLIGTPPNLIVSGFRAQRGAGGFAMFDFTPVGLAVALVGVAFVALAGWRLVPTRKQSGLEGFETGAYLTEVRVLPDSKSAGQSLRQLEQVLDEAGAQVVGLVRNEIRVTAPSLTRRVYAGDILVIEAEADALSTVLSSLGLRLEESGRPQDRDEAAGQGEAASAPQTPGRTGAGAGAADGDREEGGAEGKPEAAGDIVLMELAVLPGSMLAGRSASDVLLRTRYGINLLALSRQGHRLLVRLRLLPIKPGDLLLMQGPADAISGFAADTGCVPLAERELRIPSRRKAWLAVAIMSFSVGTAAFGLLPAAISFALGVLASMALRTVPPRSVYEAVDWPVVVLLAALIPVAGAMQTT
ncbi:MAG: SLC13 family permease, partial [Polaromonas sp.]